MMIPDYALVAEVMLLGEGFEDSRGLARKMVKLYKLASEQLSQQVCAQLKPSAGAGGDLERRCSVRSALMAGWDCCVWITARRLPPRVPQTLPPRRTTTTLACAR